MSISKTRGILYFLARILGDVSAVQKGKVDDMIESVLAGKVSIIEAVINKKGGD